MSVKLLDTGGTNELKIDADHGALRASLQPENFLGHYQVGATSGLITVLAANAPVFSFRNLAANLIIVKRISIGFSTTTAFTTAQALAWDLLFARSFTVSDSAGTAIVVTGNQNKVRTSFVAPTSIDMRISATAALTAGTRTLDTVAMAVGNGGVTAVVGSVVPIFDIWRHDASDHPLVLAQNEGLVIQNKIVMGVAGVGNLHVNVEFGEVAAY